MLDSYQRDGTEAVSLPHMDSSHPRSEKEGRIGSCPAMNAFVLLTYALSRGIIVEKSITVKHIIAAANTASSS